MGRDFPRFHQYTGICRVWLEAGSTPVAVIWVLPSEQVVWEGLCARLVEKGADMKRHEMSWTLTFVRLPFYTFEQQIREGCDRADLVSRKRLSSAIRRSSAVLGPT